MNYLAQGLSQGFDQGVATYNAKKKRQEDKAQRELENEMRQRQLDFEISHAQRQFNRQTGRDQAEDINRDRGFAFQVTSKQGDDDFRAGRATAEDAVRAFEQEMAQKKLDQAAAQFGRKMGFEEKVYGETQGPGSPAYAYPLLMGQAAMARAENKNPNLLDLTQNPTGGTAPHDNTPDGTIAVQDGVRYKKTNGQWVPIN